MAVSIVATIVATVAATVVAGLGAVALPTAAQAAPSQAAPSQAVAKGSYQELCNGPSRPDEARCFALARTDVPSGFGVVAPRATPAGYGPADLQNAYKLPTGQAGSGQTVAIVDAYDNPNAEADLAVYRAQYGLPPCTTDNGCFRKVNQRGEAAPLPAANAGWAGEIALDVQVVSATCPNCKILLVEGDSALVTDLFEAIGTAVALGAKFISNSYGLSEFEEESEYEPLLNHPGVALTFASGDEGYEAEFPASSKYVTAVGGTSLTRATNDRGWTETVWDGAGSGCSAYLDKPTFQTDTGCAKRTVADVAAVSDPATGVAVYNTYQSSGWQVYGGTSAAAPLIAAVYALAGTPVPGTYPNSYPYQSPQALFDVTSGNNGTCTPGYLCTGGPGYDGPTGLGTPMGESAFRPAGAYGEIVGTVTDAASGAPIPNTEIAAGDYTALTGADGKYRMIVPAKTYDVSAAKYGYVKQTTAGVVVPEGGKVTADFALAAAPSATLAGTVRDGSGHGWPLYAEITVAGAEGPSIFTDPFTGHYEVKLPAGSQYTLNVTPVYPGYQAAQVPVQLGTSNQVQDVELTVDQATCTAPGYAVRVEGLSQSFEAGTPPDNWMVVNHTTGGGWGFTDTGDRGNLTGGTGGFAMVDSDDLGEGLSQDTELLTPLVNLSAQTAPAVIFRSDYRSFRSVADVDLSVDGGQTWGNIWHRTDSDRGPKLHTIAVPQAAGKSAVLARFHYTGSWAWWWEIDDVIVGTRVCAPVNGGLVLGHTTDAITGAALNGVTVTSVDRPADKAVTAPTPDDPNLGDGFYWMFSGLTGAHPFNAAKAPYTTQTKTVSVGTNTTTRADFALGAGHLTITPSSRTKSVKLGETETVKFTVTNDGTAAASVQVGERDGGFTLLQRLGAGPAVQNVPGTYSKRRMTPSAKGPSNGKGVAKPANATPSAAPWTDIANYPTPVQDNLVLLNRGKVYSVGGTSDVGTVTGGAVYDPSAGAWTPIANLATPRMQPAGGFIDGKLYVVGGWTDAGPTTTSLEIYDPVSNTWSAGPRAPEAFAASAHAVLDGKLYVVGGCSDATCGFKQVYVYDPATAAWSRAADYPLDTSWSACGAIGSQLYCTGGGNDTLNYQKSYSYDPVSNLWSPVADLPIDLWGMAYASPNGQLIVSGGVTGASQVATNRGFAYDPAANAWTAIANSNNTVYRAGGACGFYKVGGSTGGFNPIANGEVLPGLDQCGSTNADVAWLSVDKTAFTVEPGASVTITATLDASIALVTQPGAYTAQLTFTTDTPYEVAPVGVTMNVTPPKTWGKIAGTVYGVRCDGSTVPLAGATVQIDTWTAHYTLRTDANGRYALWLDRRNNPLTVIVAKDGWQPQTRKEKIVAGETLISDWKLLTAQRC